MSVRLAPELAFEATDGIESFGSPDTEIPAVPVAEPESEKNKYAKLYLVQDVGARCLQGGDAPVAGLSECLQTRRIMPVRQPPVSYRLGRQCVPEVIHGPQDFK